MDKGAKGNIVLKIMRLLYHIKTELSFGLYLLVYIFILYCFFINSVV